MDKQIISQLRTNQTKAEKILWEQLRNRKFLNLKFRRQVAIDTYIIDFISFEQMLIIELDGEQHNSEERKKYDKKRTNYLVNKRYKVLRFWNNDVVKDIEYVLRTINLTLNPSPASGEGKKR